MINYKFSLEVKIWVLINIQLKNEMNSTYRLLTTYFAKSLRFAQIYRVLSKTNGTIINTDLQGTICKTNEKSVQSQEFILQCPITKEPLTFRWTVHFRDRPLSSDSSLLAKLRYELASQSNNEVIASA